MSLDQRFVLLGFFAIASAALCSCSSNKQASGAAGQGAQAAGAAGSQGMMVSGTAPKTGTGGTGVGTGTTGGAGATQTAGTGGTKPGNGPDAQGGAGAQASTGGASGSGGATGTTQADCSPADWKDPGTVSSPKVVAVAADAGKTGHMFGRTPGLSDVDYVEEEFFFTGTSPAYTTRMVVERPKDPAKYNGTVMMEWYNVSGQVDFAPDWMYSRAYFVREGYVHISVSAQQAGTDALKSYDPDRYMAINHPGDDSANAIFSQAAMAVRSQGELLFGGPCMPVRALVAIGQSQSAFRLADYVDNEQPKAKLIDGFVLHSGLEPASNNPPVPVFEIFSMTEGNVSLSDGPNLVKWVIAGATHNDDFITKEGLAELGADVGITTMTECANPMNNFPSYRAYDAAFDWVNKWVRKGERPPAGAPYEMTGNGLKLDADGNVLGGVRLPEIDVPTASYGTDNSAKDPTDLMSAFVCSLSGNTVAFTADKLQALYPTHDDYVKKYTNAADKALAAGYLLQADYDEGIKKAQSAPVPN
jgi:hypothetical protein